MKSLITGSLIAILSIASAEEHKSEVAHLHSIRQSMQAIHKHILDLRSKELSEKEIDDLLSECEHQMVGANQIQTLVLGHLLMNPSLSDEQKEKTRELLLRNLDYHWLDSHPIDQLISPYLFSLNKEEDELLQPSATIYSEDLWSDLSPAAQKIYMSSIFSAHKKAIYFDLVRRHKDLEISKEESTDPVGVRQ